ncbi:MAG: ParA family protein, partial [Sphingomonadaceae bacterium]
MQSLAGGVGKTTLVMERAIRDRQDGLKVLVIDTCRSPCLTNGLTKLGFEVIADLRQIFGAMIESHWKVTDFPVTGLICLPPELKSSRADIPFFRDLDMAVFHAYDNLERCAQHYDTCYIDCETGDVDLAMAMTLLSNVVNFFPRIVPASTVEDWKAKY